MMTSSWTLTSYISQTVHFQTLLRKETLIRIELWFQWCIGWYGLEEKFAAKINADISTHVSGQSFSVKKIISCDIIMKFLKFHVSITNWSITQKLCSKTPNYNNLRNELSI